MIQRLQLTPTNPTLIGAYSPKADSVVVVLTGGTFSVELPSLGLCEKTQFYFFNIGAGTVTLNSRSINGVLGASHAIYTGDSAMCVDSMGGTWLVINTRSGGRLDTPLQIGDDTNNTAIETDGTIKFKGSATVFEDLNFAPIKSGGPAATRPDDVTINNCFYKEFTSANNQNCGDQQELPHHYKLSSVLYGHGHCFLKSGESVGTTGVTFTVYWELRGDAATTSGSFTLSATSAQLTASPNKLNMFAAAGFAGSDTLGSQLALTLARTGGNAGDVIVTTYGVHYELDTNGSRTITTK